MSDLERTDALDPTLPGPGGRRHRFADLYHERTNYQFIDRSWRWAVVSGTAVVVSLLFLVFGGLNLGIDFEGGTQWQLTVARGSADAGEVRDVMVGAGQDNPKVVILGGGGVRVQAPELTDRERASITTALAEYAGVEESEISVTNVGPTWGDQVTRKAIQALLVFFAAVALYLSLRFEWRMAVAAIVAVIHDIIITAGVYAITGFDVTPATVVAVLTILGFSLYDTVVVFDKVKEHEATLVAGRGETYSQMVNRSLNEVLMRSLNTSFVAVLPVLSLLVVGRFGLGAVGLQDFALALLVGLIVGAYSSVFVATPLLAWLKEREPKYRSIRERVTVQRARGLVPAAAPASTTPASVPVPGGAVATLEPEPGSESGSGAAEGGGSGPAPAGVGPGPDTPTEASGRSAPPTAPKPAPKPSPGGGVTPRPRQKRRKSK